MYIIDKFLRSEKYDPVRSEDVERESDTSSTTDGYHASRPRSDVSNLMRLLPWALAAFFAFISLILFIEIYKQPELGTYETDFETDLHIPSPIPLEKVRFRGTPHFHNNGTPWTAPPDNLAPWPENLQFVGEPNPQVDENWQQLIGQRYFSVSEEEAKRAWGERRHDYVDQNGGGYTAGLDMFHTLHCLNEIRKILRPDYYFEDGIVPKSADFHNDHCIEILRQTVQCYGSTTLIPTTYIDGVEHNYIDSDQEHVCRSFNHLRDYTSSRTKGAVNDVPRDQSLLDPKKHVLSLAWGAKFGDNAHSGGHIG